LAVSREDYFSNVLSKGGIVIFWGICTKNLFVSLKNRGIYSNTNVAILNNAKS